MISSAPARVFDMLLSPPLARATNDRPAVMFQPSDSYTCSTIPLEHRLRTCKFTARPQWAVALTMGGVDHSVCASGQCARAAYKILNEIMIAILEVQ